MKCNDHALQSLLDAEEGSAEYRVVADHVESCAHCQSRLTELAGDATEWETLKQRAAETADSERVADRPWQFSGRGAPSGDWTEAMSRQLLAPSTHPEMLGRIGRYDVERLLGAGGMGVVYKAFDTELNRPVAIKVLAPFLAGSGAARQRFAREARAAAAVVDEHVVAIHNVESEGDAPFLVMQFVPGSSLQTRLDQRGPLDVREILRIAMQTAVGLAAAHQQGLIHRDVKPSNIMLEEDIERALLTDFGLARAGDDATLTHTGYHPGTPHYMSPEQARGESIDERSDLFSLGSVMYAMCTGRVPFRAETSYGVLRRITDGEPAPIRELNPEVPEWLCEFINTLMAKSPEQRFASAREVAERLAGYLAHVQHPTSVALPGPRPVAPMPRGKRRGNGRRPLARRIAAAGAAAALCLAGVLITLEWNKGTLKIECDADRVSVRVSRGEQVVKRLTVTRSGKTVRVAAGTYVVEIEGETDNFVIEDGRIELHRGESRLVRIVQQDRALGDSRSPPRPRPQVHPAPPDHEAVPLSDAVHQFNQHQAEHPIGKELPPLTDDEVVASVRWAGNGEPFDGFAQEVRRQFTQIAEQRVLPQGWRLQTVTEFPGAEAERFRVWSVRLVLRRADGSPFSHDVRTHFLTPLDADGQPLAEDPVTAPADADARPLAAAIQGFNNRHRRLGGMEQPPLTEQEVVAAIRWWKTRRAKLDVTDRDFAALQAIADRRRMPKDAEFEVVSGFRPGDGFDYLIWSVRLGLPRTAGRSPFPRFGITIRNHYVRSRAVDDGHISWGPVAPDGLQVGVRFDPHNEQYVAGQLVRPRFFYRNTSDQIAEMSFPRQMTHSYYEEIIAVDAAGNPVDIEQDPWPGGPVGWTALSFGFGARHEIRGRPIVIGDVERGSAETKIGAKPGQSVRVRFLLPNFGDQQAAPLRTGDIRFTMAAPVR